MLHVEDFKDFSSGSESNSKLNEQTLAHIQTLKDAFQQIDKDFDSILTPSELLSFLDNRMKSGQFDRNIATKLFSYIDKDNKGFLSVDIIRSYAIEITSIVGKSIKQYDPDRFVHLVYDALQIQQKTPYCHSFYFIIEFNFILFKKQNMVL